MLKRFFDFLLFGNIYIAAGAVCLIQSTVKQLGFPDHLYSYSLLAFFATLFIYNLQRIYYRTVNDNKLNSIRRKWISEHQKPIQILTIIGFTGVVITFFLNEFRIVFYLSPLLILSIAYFIPFVKLRKSAWFKLLTLSTVWTITTAVIPMLLGSPLLLHPIVIWQMVLHILLRFSYVMAICIPFDIRDISIDTAEDVSTLPLKIGESKTKVLAILVTVLFGLITFLELITSTISIPVFIALVISMVVTLLSVVFCNSKRSEYYFVAGIDGTMILQGVLLLLIT